MDNTNLNIIEQAEENAKDLERIKSFAPEMLESLSKLTFLIIHNTDLAFHSGVIEARAIIAKAKGESK